MQVTKADDQQAKGQRALERWASLRKEGGELKGELSMKEKGKTLVELQSDACFLLVAAAVEILSEDYSAGSPRVCATKVFDRAEAIYADDYGQREKRHDLISAVLRDWRIRHLKAIAHPSDDYPLYRLSYPRGDYPMYLERT